MVRLLNPHQSWIAGQGLGVDAETDRVQPRKTELFAQLMNRLKPNIPTKGRIVRGLGAVALAVGGLLLWPVHVAPAIILWIASAFVFFEAFKGWCALRACGIKTKF